MSAGGDPAAADGCPEPPADFGRRQLPVRELNLAAVNPHPANVDGIYFVVSRFAAEPCVAIYERAGIITRGMAVTLMNAPELGLFLDKYQIGLV